MFLCYCVIDEFIVLCLRCCDATVLYMFERNYAWVFDVCSSVFLIGAAEIMVLRVCVCLSVCVCVYVYVCVCVCVISVCVSV